MSLFSHLAVLRASGSLSRDAPALPQVAFLYSAPGAGPLPPALPQLSYPDSSVLQRSDGEGYTSPCFVVVLTLETGERLYGYTRRMVEVAGGAGGGSRYPSALLLLSHLAAPALFGSILESVHVRWHMQPSSLFSLADRLARAGIPSPGSTLPLVVGGGPRADEWIELAVPDPALESPWPLMPLARALSLPNLLLLFSALLCEQRVLLISARLPRLSACVHAAASLLSPMRWPHILVPALPRSLLSYALAPMPFLCGVHASMLDELLSQAGVDGSIVLVDLDSDRVSLSADSIAQVRAEQLEEDEEADGDGADPRNADPNAAFTFPLPAEAGFKLRRHLKSRWGGPVTQPAPPNPHENEAAFAHTLVPPPQLGPSGPTLGADPLCEGDLFEAFLCFFLQLLAPLDFRTLPLDRRGKVSLDALCERVDLMLQPNHASWVRRLGQSQAVERLWDELSVRLNPVRAAERTKLLQQQQQQQNGGSSTNVLTPVERFERLRGELVAAAASSEPSKPLEPLRSFSFVLKRVRAHLDSAREAAFAQSQASFDRTCATLGLPRVLPSSEVRRVALELTSNTPLSAKRRAADLLQNLADASMSTKALGALLPTLWERLVDSRKANWGHAHKALGVIDYLLRHGGERVLLHAAYAPLPQRLLQHLAFTYTHEHDRTESLIRTAAARTYHTLQNVFLLRQVRPYARGPDLRRFRYLGAMQEQVKRAQADHETANDATLAGDPDFDAYRQQSLVERLAPALPPFERLHANYAQEFAGVDDTKEDSSDDDDGAAGHHSPVSPLSPHAAAMRRASSVRRQASISGALSPPTPSHAATVIVGERGGTHAAQGPIPEFDFARFDGTLGFGNEPMPPIRAIMPPKPAQASHAAPTVAPPANVASSPAQQWQQQQQQAHQPRVANIIDTSLFAGPLAIMPPASMPQSTLSNGVPAKPSLPPPSAASPAQTVPAPALPSQSFHPSVASPARAPAPVSAPAPAPAAAPVAAPRSGSSAIHATAESLASPWAAFDSAFADADSPAPAPSLGPAHAAPRAIAPPKPQQQQHSLDPTAGLDLFFAVPPPTTQAAAPPPPSAERRKKKKRDTK